MDNAIFKKLSDTIQNPTRSREWFGMAEQAINTIYALGEHPDVLCNDIIKSLTKRVFAKERSTPKQRQSQSNERDDDAMEEDQEPAQGDESDTEKAEQESQSGDTGDAFELSQLLFVVGHVAIKQIVYLELVEREWKRQKDEKEKGTLTLILRRRKREVNNFYSGEEQAVECKGGKRFEGWRGTRPGCGQRGR